MEGGGPPKEDSMATKREKAVERMVDNGQWEQGMSFTCDSCDQSEECKWSYDPYNTNGDCLGDK